jgi:hypothetical protein
MNGEREFAVVSSVYKHHSNKQVPFLAAHIPRPVSRAYSDAQSVLTSAPDWDQFCFISPEVSLFRT